MEAVRPSDGILPVSVSPPSRWPATLVEAANPNSIIAPPRPQSTMEAHEGRLDTHPQDAGRPASRHGASQSLTVGRTGQQDGRTAGSWTATTTRLKPLLRICIILLFGLAPLVYETHNVKLKKSYQ
eukprot:GHVT01083456.1.p1 GENE.GHVT01083456.1~~GHVT01083456.1.p1  ORF type:complete len:126 (-),score=14.44 GHVT01083456.1:44-421(-)